MDEYIGIDFHKQTSYITRMYEKGNILEQIKVKTREEKLEEFLRKHIIRSKIAIETTGNWYYFYELKGT